MPNAIRNFLAAVVALPLALAACGTETATDNSGVEGINLDLKHRYGFVSIVDGTMGVVDLETMAVVNRVNESSRASHMLHALPGQRDVFYGDWDTNDVLRVHFSEDMGSYEVAERIPSPVQMHGFMTYGEDDRYLIVLSRLELTGKVLFEVEHNDTAIARYDRETGEWDTLELGSPSFASFGPDGRLYVSNVHHKSISVVDLDTFTEVEQVAVGGDNWATGASSIGPKAVEFSPDGRTMVTADYEGMSLTLFDVTENGLENKRLIPMNGVPKSLVFTNDGAELWVVTYDLTSPKESIHANAGTYQSMGDWYEGPQPANETANAYRNTTMHIFETDNMSEIGSFTTPKAMIAPKMSSADANLVYVTTSAGSIYAVDRTSLKLMGEAVVGRVGLPVICGNLAQ